MATTTTTTASARECVRGVRKGERHKVERDGAAVVCGKADGLQFDHCEGFTHLRARWCLTEGKGEGGTGEGDQGHRRGRAETVGDEQRLALLHEARGQRERKNVREKW